MGVELQFRASTRNPGTWLKVCPHCRSTIDPKAYVCAHCARSVPLPSQADYDIAQDRVQRAYRTGPYRPSFARRFVVPWFFTLWALASVYLFFFGIFAATGGTDGERPHDLGAALVLWTIMLTPWAVLFLARRSRQ